MATQSQSTISIPASLVPRFEAWGRLTVKLFGDPRRQAGLKPHDVPDDQACYWSEQWQQREWQADEDTAADQVKEFGSVNDLIADLDV